MPWRMLSAFTSHDISRSRPREVSRSYRPPLSFKVACLDNDISSQGMRPIDYFPSSSNNSPSEKKATAAAGARVAASSSESYESRVDWRYGAGREDVAESRGRQPVQQAREAGRANGLR